jgi:hypothetical protein
VNHLIVTSLKSALTLLLNQHAFFYSVHLAALMLKTDTAYDGTAPPLMFSLPQQQTHEPPTARYPSFIDYILIVRGLNHILI